MAETKQVPMLLLPENFIPGDILDDSSYPDHWGGKVVKVEPHEKKEAMSVTIEGQVGVFIYPKEERVRVLRMTTVLDVEDESDSD